MTRVYIEREVDHFTIDVKGHATGSVEMCAMISCLVYTIAGWAENERGVRLQQKRLEDGDARLVMVGDLDAISFIHDLALVGFLQLEEHDPAHIVVSAKVI